MTYEDFFEADEVATFKRMKKAQMELAGIARGIAAVMVGGTVLGNPGGGPGKGKEFVRTSLGLYRLSIGPNADNTTEQAAHERMGAVCVVMGDESGMRAWFRLHGITGDFAAYLDFKSRIRAAVNPS